MGNAFVYLIDRLRRAMGAKKASKWFTSRGLQLPKLVQTIIDANTNVAQKATGVNTQSMQAISKTKKKTLYVTTANRRAYQLLNIESQPIGAKGSQQNAVSPVTLPTDTPTIADLIAIVKSKDASYKPKAPEDVLVDDLAATEGTFLTRDDVSELVEKAVNDATNIPEQLKRYVLKKIRKDDGGLAQKLWR